MPTFALEQIKEHGYFNTDDFAPFPPSTNGDRTIWAGYRPYPAQTAACSAFDGTQDGMGTQI